MAAATTSPAGPCSTIAPAAALTTVFIEPSSCPKPTALNDQGLPEIYSCMPPNFSKYWNCPIVSGYYSPAICPSGYTVAASRWDDQQGPSLASGETAGICCPFAYTTTANEPSHCVKGSTLAIAIQIRWQSSDISILQTHPLISENIISGTGTTASSGVLASSPPTSDTSYASLNSHSGMTGGATAGVVIGTVLGAFLVAFVALLLCRRRGTGTNKLRKRIGAMPALGTDDVGAGDPVQPSCEGPVIEGSSEMNKEMRERAAVEQWRLPQYQDRRVRAPVTSPPTRRPPPRTAAVDDIDSQEPLPLYPLTNRVEEGSRQQPQPQLESMQAIQPTQTIPEPRTTQPSPRPYHETIQSNAGATPSPSGRVSRKEVVPESGLEVVPSPIPEPGLEIVEEHPELVKLREEQRLIQERRVALLKLKELDQEEERIRRRIAELESGKGMKE